MSREWKTGEMVLVTFDNATGIQRAEGINRVVTKPAIVDADHVGSTAEPAEAWFVFGATTRIGATWESVREARSLVVIDPEDRDAVERLLDLYFAAIVSGATSRDAMQAALRESADPKPARPEEPMGLGAVVEDGRGQKWVRVEEAGAAWCPSDRAGSFSCWADFSDAVKVLSEGVR